MYVPFKANDDDGVIHHLRSEYRDLAHANSGTPPLKVVDTKGDPVTCDPSTYGIGRYVLKDGTALDSNDENDPY